MENGLQPVTCDMVEVYKLGLMGLGMKAFGSKIKQMEKEC